MSVLMYGAETWALRAKHVRHLTVLPQQMRADHFRFQQWEQRLTTKSLASNGLVHSRHHPAQEVQWLGHLGRMGDDRLPKNVQYCSGNCGRRDGPKCQETC